MTQQELEAGHNITEAGIRELAACFCRSMVGIEDPEEDIASFCRSVEAAYSRGPRTLKSASNAFAWGAMFGCVALFQHYERLTRPEHCPNF